MKENIIKENVVKQDVNIIGVKSLDFTSTDGSRVCGYKIFYTRELTKDESITNFGKSVENVFLSKDNLDDLDKWKNKIYPIRGVLQFEVVSTSRKPKLINVVI